MAPHEVLSETATFELLSLEGYSVASSPHDAKQDGYNGSTKTAEIAVSPEKLGIIPLVVMIFYSVSGGPFGCEATVRTGGNFYTLLGFGIMPFIWSMQEALVTAELGTAFPEASGGVAWVEEAFGQNAGWMCGYLGWIAGATDNAIYPVLFLEYVLRGEAMDAWLRFSLLSCASIVLGYINWLGLPLVGKMSITIGCIAMSPFIIMTVVGVFQLDTSRWLERPQEDASSFEQVEAETGGGFFPYAMPGGVMLRPFLNNLFWNLNSFDTAASFAAEVDDPGRTLPRAMMYSVLLVFVCYFFPMLVAIGATGAQQSEWVDGYLASITSEIAGPWLGAWTVFAAGISNIALFQCELSADAFQLMGMAERGYLPKVFATRSKHGTPTYGIVLGTIVICLLGMANLAVLIEMLNFNYAISLLLELSAFIKLRIYQPDLHRPYRIPLNTVGCILLLTPTFMFTLVVLSLATYHTYAFVICVNVAGISIFQVRKRTGMMYRAVSESLFGSSLDSSGDATNLEKDMGSELTPQQFVTRHFV